MAEPGQDLNDAGLAAYRRGGLEEASRLWREAAALGHGHAMRNLGLDDEDAGNIDGALEWYHSAIQAGCISACIELGNVYIKREQWDLARQSFRVGADAGDLDSMFWLSAVGYRRGDLSDGQEWIKRAAERGHVRSMLEIARRAETVDDMATATSWWQRAADLGSFRACSNMAGLACHESRQEEVIAWVDRALEAPDRDQATDLEISCLYGLKGSALEILGQYSQAIIELQKARPLPQASNTDIDAQIARLERYLRPGSFHGSDHPNTPQSRATTVRATSSTTAFCKDCGARLNPGARFCGKCGASLT